MAKITVRKNTVKITLDGGGFHNVGPISVIVPKTDFDGASTISDPIRGDEWKEIEITEYQFRRISNHYCDLSDCCCSGAYGILNQIHNRYALVVSID